jgi:predicted enzyme related to lactoylglutathione lyase
VNRVAARRDDLLARSSPVCGTNAYVCSLEVSDIDSAAQNILSLGGKVSLPKLAVAGVCWHDYFIDPDGNTLGVFQPDSTAK